MTRIGVVAAGLAGLTACESGTWVTLDVVVPDDVAARYSPEAPGILETDVWAAITPVCGGDGFTAHLDADGGFGCRPDDPTVTVWAWIAPIPAEWDPEAFCALDTTESGIAWPTSYDTGADPFPMDGRAVEPGPTDPQGSTEAKWKWTPICGGDLEAEITLHTP